MPTIKNMSYGPVSFRLADDSTLTLGPRETADISSEDFDNSAIQQNLRERRIAILPGRGGSSSSSSSSSQPAQPEPSSGRREAKTNNTPMSIPE